MKPEAEILLALAVASGYHAPDHRITSLNGRALLKNNRTKTERKNRKRRKLSNTSKRRNRQ